MKIKWTSKDDSSDVELISEERAVELLEGHGFYKKDTVIKSLEAGNCLQSFFAYFEKA